MLVPAAAEQVILQPVILGEQAEQDREVATVQAEVQASMAMVVLVAWVHMLVFQIMQDLHMAQVVEGAVPMVAASVAQVASMQVMALGLIAVQLLMELMHLGAAAAADGSGKTAAVMPMVLTQVLVAAA